MWPSLVTDIDTWKTRRSDNHSLFKSWGICLVSEIFDAIAGILGELNAIESCGLEWAPQTSLCSMQENRPEKEETTCVTSKSF